MPVDEKGKKDGIKLEEAGPHGGPGAAGAAGAAQEGESKADAAETPAVTMTQKVPVGSDQHTLIAKTTPNGVDIEVHSTPKTLDELKAEFKAARVSAAALKSEDAPIGGNDVFDIIKEVEASEDLMQKTLKAHQVTPDPSKMTARQRLTAAAEEMKKNLSPSMVRVSKAVSKMMMVLTSASGGGIRKLPDGLDVRNRLYLNSQSGWGEARR